MATGMDRLTVREREVLHLISEGLGNKQIASRLGIGLDTVKHHVHEIMLKLEAANRTEAAVVWLRFNGGSEVGVVTADPSVIVSNIVTRTQNTAPKRRGGAKPR